MTTKKAQAKASDYSDNPFLPAQPFPHERSRRERMIRVNLAGEEGAIALYTGQLKALKDHERCSLIEEMEEHEQEHVALFQRETVKFNVRPSALRGLWHCLGVGAGYAAGRLGFDFAMAQTEAVETVIADHYAAQLKVLPKDDPLCGVVEACLADELAHRDHGHQESRPGLDMDAWKALTRLGTRLAIAVAKRL